MKAAVHTRYGPPEVVQIAEVPMPSVGDEEVLVRVHATTVNRTDCGYRAGKPFIVRFFSGLTGPRAAILGTEFAGVVEEVGAGVASYRRGDRVFGYCEGPFGAHAEYMSIRADASMALMPPDMTFARAAAGTEGAHYAMAFLRVGRVEPGQDVLVYGATGAIGSAAVQLARSMGATVTAVCDTANVELVRSLGADRVVDYTTEDFTQDTQRYDAVLDAVGKSSYGQCRRLLKPRGVYLSSELGPKSQNLLLPLVTPMFGGRRVKFPSPGHDQLMVRRFRELMESGQFTPVIDRTYPLDRIVEAYRYVETGRKVGNVIISVVPAT